MTVFIPLTAWSMPPFSPPQMAPGMVLVKKCSIGCTSSRLKSDHPVLHIRFQSRPRPSIQLGMVLVKKWETSDTRYCPKAWETLTHTLVRDRPAEVNQPSTVWFQNWFHGPEMLPFHQLTNRSHPAMSTWLELLYQLGRSLLKKSPIGCHTSLSNS